MQLWPHDRNIKHHALLAFYRGFDWEKCSYRTFMSRVTRYGFSKEEAMKKERFSWKWMIKWEIQENWRECSKCGIFKEWTDFPRDLSSKHRYCSNCKECRNKTKAETRKLTHRKKDKEYEAKARKLTIWEYIAFLNPLFIDGVPREDVREVVGYQFKKGYSIRSIHTWLYRTLDTGDNQKVNKNSRRFYRVDAPIELIPQEEIEPNLY